MKKYFTLFTALVTVLCAVVGFKGYAQSVTAEQASTVCSRFLQERNPSATSFQLEETLIDNDGFVSMYRFSLNGSGFVIVSASTSVTPVVAYSFEDNYEPVPTVISILDNYKRGIRLAEQKLAPALPQVTAAWQHYLAADFVPDAIKTPTRGPLLTTKWNQNEFYNTYCPWDANAGDYYDYRVPNGCVALACAQIFNYHRYPDQGQGATIYMPVGYPMQTVYFNQHHYNYDAMYKEPQSYANEISKLTYHIGVALKMMYGIEGSGSFSEDVLEQLRDRFGYDWTMTLLQRDIYLDTNVNTFINILKGDIDLLRPMYYAAGGHAFVLDDYDSDSRFHLNLGWGGYGNGYYAMDNFLDFNEGGRCYINMIPKTSEPDTYCQTMRRQTASFGTIADGSRPTKPYPANPDCSWMVSVPGATGYHFTVDRLDVNPDADVITIYNGPTVESGVKETITGRTLPTQTINVYADSVLITFTSNGSVATNTDYYGWLISYSSDVPVSPCHSINVVNEWHTIITDESGDGENYVPQTNCTWTVSLNYINGYSINFRKFDLGYGDFVDVYNNTTNPPTLYKRFDIYNMPEGPYTVNFKKMRINFVADNWDQKDGFALEYWAIAGVDDHSGIEDMNLYPNPATDQIHIAFSLQNAEPVTCRLTDATGKILQTEQLSATTGDNHHTINVANLAHGFYFLEMSTTQGKTIRKVMVQ